MRFFYFSAVALSVMVTAGVFSAAAAAEWGYKGDISPQHWGALDPSYAPCATGQQQSPVNIDTGKSVDASLPPLKFEYKSSPGTITNDGHTIQVTPDDGGDLILNGKTYHLVQFHFHSPSEEKIDGKTADMVIHLVHKADDGTLAVVAILLKVGAENPVLAPIFAAMPHQVNTRVSMTKIADATELLPADRHYYHYIGSLTVPPCSEGVSWQIMATPVTLSAQQLADFRQLYLGNVRPIQPLNGRSITVGP